MLHSKSITSKVIEGEKNKNLQSIYLHMLKMTKLIICLWHCFQKREKLLKMINSNQENQGEVTTNYPNSKEGEAI